MLLPSPVNMNLESMRTKGYYYLNGTYFYSALLLSALFFSNPTKVLILALGSDFSTLGIYSLFFSRYSLAVELRSNKKPLRSS